MRHSLISLLFILAGAAILGVLMALHHLLLGHAIESRAVVLPLVAGGFLGLLFSLWYRHNDLFKKHVVHHNLVLQTIRNVNRLLTQEKSRDRFIQGVCDNLVEHRGYYNAWIALKDAQDRWVSFFQSGLGQESEQILNDLQQGRILACCQRALHQPGIVVTDEPTTLCIHCPRANFYANNSAISSRLEYDGQIYGVMTLCIAKEMVFDRREQQLAEEIACDIAFGLYNIQLQNDREQNEKRFRSLIENALAGISIIQDNEVVYQNKEQERLLGPLPRSSILGDYENIHPDDIAKVKQLTEDITSGKIKLLDVDFRYTNKNATTNPIWIHCRGHVIEFRNKESIFLNLMDMTQIKNLESLLRMQDKMASLGRVTAGIAHEIRNPLSGINIYTNTLEKYLDRDEAKEKIRNVLQHMQLASRKIESIIRRVMDFAKPGAPNFTFTDINQPVKEALKLTAVTLRKSGIALEKELADNLPKCHLDPTQMEEVILNLLNNAADAMRKSSGEKKIKVITAADSQHVSVRVIDSGPGLQTEVENQIFDPFFTTKADSTGIGLSICHRIVGDHGGSISAHTGEGGGAVFAITLPLSDERPLSISDNQISG